MKKIMNIEILSRNKIRLFGGKAIRCKKIIKTIDKNSITGRIDYYIEFYQKYRDLSDFKFKKELIKGWVLNCTKDGIVFGDPLLEYGSSKYHYRDENGNVAQIYFSYKRPSDDGYIDFHKNVATPRSNIKPIFAQFG